MLVDYCWTVIGLERWSLPSVKTRNPKTDLTLGSSAISVRFGKVHFSNAMTKPTTNPIISLGVIDDRSTIRAQLHPMDTRKSRQRTTRASASRNLELPCWIHYFAACKSWYLHNQNLGHNLLHNA
jgi:hypothetical protein